MDITFEEKECVFNITAEETGVSMRSRNERMRRNDEKKCCNFVSSVIFLQAPNFKRGHAYQIFEEN